MLVARRVLVVTVALATVALTSLPDAHAGQIVIPNKCTAGKIKCVKAKATKVAACYSAFIKKPAPDPPAADKLGECIGKALDTFNACIAKIEAKEKPDKPETLCAFLGDGTTLGNATFAFVQGDVVVPLHPTLPTSPNTCAAAKIKCSVKKAKELLCCHEKAFKKGAVLEEKCLNKARDAFDGGSDPSKACFAKLEAKEKINKPATICPTQGDTGPIEASVDEFVADIISQIVMGSGVD